MTYFELMEKSLSAYSTEHIEEYFSRVKRDGLTEHGFPRLTANIGILIARGRRLDLFNLFLEMMDFCCEQIPKVKAANDFSVREIICALSEIEKSGKVDSEKISLWKAQLASIDPPKCYTVYAENVEDEIANWALFTAVSEYFRQKAGLCNSEEFIDLQIANQLRRFDENGMYMDHLGTDVHQPIMYDIVPRGLFALMLDCGYRGKYYEDIDRLLKKAGLYSLKMLSSNGEMAFGGRSNQFIHNEAWLAAIFSYEAKRYAKEGNPALAKEFGSATARAMSITVEWLNKKPITHIKNRFPTETKYGCEKYAYFDKYMITVASNLYAAYLIAGENIPIETVKDTSPCVFETSYHFHKLFLKSGGYTAEFDTNADPHYDANGLGRVIRTGAPSAICMALPCPECPSYTVDTDEPFAFSICPAFVEEEHICLGADSSARYSVLEARCDKNIAYARLSCQLNPHKRAEMHTYVCENGVSIKVTAEARVGIAFPAFSFDGETKTDINVTESTVTVSYLGWKCVYATDGKIFDIKKVAKNRSGYYRTFVAMGDKEITLTIDITVER